MNRVTVIDYGIVNLKNIIRAVEHVGGDVDVCSDPEQLVKADRVIFPGVGAFESGVKEMRTRGLDDAMRLFASSGKPILGICLGMQMLLESSNEYGEHKGLGLFPGQVRLIPTDDEIGRTRKIPHIGWNAVNKPFPDTSWVGTCLQSTREGTFFYFVHSYSALPDTASHILAQCVYQGVTLIAAIRKDNITGLQFHPERSGPSGLLVLKQFLAQ